MIGWRVHVLVYFKFALVGVARRDDFPLVGFVSSSVCGGVGGGGGGGGVHSGVVSMMDALIVPPAAILFGASSTACTISG